MQLLPVDINLGSKTRRDSLVCKHDTDSFGHRIFCPVVAAFKHHFGHLDAF